MKKFSPIITLTTDFGTSDVYVGVMKGVILNINPNAQIVDITHAIPPQNIHEAAFAIQAAYRYFPKGTIHVIIVDPGVGSDRLPLIVRTERHWFVGPDNGLWYESGIEQHGGNIAQPISSPRQANCVPERVSQ